MFDVAQKYRDKWNHNIITVFLRVEDIKEEEDIFRCGAVKTMEDGHKAVSRLTKIDGVNMCSVFDFNGEGAYFQAMIKRPLPGVISGIGREPNGSKYIDFDFGEWGAERLTVNKAIRRQLSGKKVGDEVKEVFKFVPNFFEGYLQ